MISIGSDKELSELAEKLQRGASKQELSDYIRSKLSPQQEKSLERILGDEQALAKILSSQKAKDLLRKLGGDDNG